MKNQREKRETESSDFVYLRSRKIKIHSRVNTSESAFKQNNAQ